MTYIPDHLREMVIGRARQSCEYCLVHSDYTAFVHEIDHVIAVKHGGATSPENLAYACAHCNRYKGSDISSVDPLTDEIVPLLNPRDQSWHDHLRLDGATITALSAVGRVTVKVLRLNHIDRVLLRRELIATGRYPFKFGEASKD